MWQIGIDVLPAYRRQGIASALTSRLAVEILRRGRCRFIVRHGRTCGRCATLSAAGSARPGWNWTAKSAAFVRELNGEK